ncbi:hypothetical protein [Halosolutus gelatinilyticus]|uniref:hypothetical protein n=1 Tax=Halosolutus gelatinilyticus TaxID=2931975 RepID=UPI001FF27ECF|nr:hypothetical protein [Halosolutus gelatinilyticus]
MAQNPRTSESDTAPTTGRKPRLSRRNYVRSLATVAAATATAGVAGTTAADEKYETIPAENQSITVGDGETWENKLIDMTTGQDITINAQGSEWTIRNIGFQGKNVSGTGSATFGVADTGGTSTIENVYLGDGSDDRNATSHGYGQTAVWVNPIHSGHLDIKNVNIQSFADNAIYASAPGLPGKGGGGTVHIDSSFAANCYVSHYRLGSEGSKVTNSNVLINDDGYEGRGIWAWTPGTIKVEGCQLEMNGHHTAIDAGANGNATSVVVSETDYDKQAGIAEHAGSAVKLKDDVGTDPEASIPDGVPTSPEEAANGSGK